MIVGHGWDEEPGPSRSRQRATELDRAAAGVAVYLARVDVHSAVVSSTLLDQLPAVSTAVGYRSDGLLTREAHHLCRGSLDRLFTDQERRSAARTALRMAAAQGVADGARPGWAPPRADRGPDPSSRGGGRRLASA